MSQRRREENRKQREAAENSYTRRNFLKAGLGAAAAGVLGYGGYGLLHESEPTFEEAKKDKTKRADYVKSVVRRFGLDKLPYIKIISYDDSIIPESRLPKAIKQGLIRTNIRPAEIGKKTRHEVQVLRDAFETPVESTENCFLNSLIDHEVEGHARPAYFGFDDIGGLIVSDFEVKGRGHQQNEKLLISVLELYAYRNQADKASLRGVTQKAINDIFFGYWAHYSELINPDADQFVEPSALRRYRELFFQRGFLEGSISSRYYTGNILLPEGKMGTIYGIIELPDCLKAKISAWRKEAK